MKKALIVSFIFVIAIAIIVFFFLKSQNYSILEINADNYNSKLHLSNKSVFDSHIDYCIPDNIPLLWSSQFATQNTTNGSGLKIVRDQSKSGEIKMEISSSNTGLQYNVFCNGDNQPPVRININSVYMSPEPLLKDISEQLVLKEGFIHKETDHLSGNDILIKEIPTDFIIVEISSNKYKYKEPPTQLRINAYSKKKYFN